MHKYTLTIRVTSTLVPVLTLHQFFFKCWLSTTYMRTHVYWESC